MKAIDYNYIAIMINSFSGVPVRIYKDNKLTFYYSSVNLIKDPIALYQSDILNISGISVIFSQYILVTMELSISMNIRL